MLTMLAATGAAAVSESVRGLCSEERGMSDIDTMEAGPELDALIMTEVMEWTLLNRREWGWGEGPPIWSTGDDDNPTRQGFCPTTDIAAAWEVVKWGTPFGSLSWSVHRFHSSAGTDHECRADCGHISGHAPTAPLAICRAVLNAVRGES